MHRLFISIALVTASALVAQDPPKTAAPKVRKLEIGYESAIADIPAGTKLLRVWMPMPRNEPVFQDVITATVEPIPGAKVTEKTDKSGENRYWVIDVPNPPTSVTVKATMQVKRTEVINNKFDGAGMKKLSPEDKEKLKDALAANEKVPTTGEIEKITDQAVPVGETNSVKLARKIYDHVLGTMKYSKEGTGWGQGDTLWACTNKYGNCTDFHSVFMSMGRLRGIPVRFSMGLPVPEKKGEGAIGGYHCWAEFFVPELGWVPVDISEADKNPSLAEYYFGSLTADRVGFTRGRDLELDPAPASGKQNFFIYPIVEVDGKKHPEKHSFKYKDLD